MTAKPPPIPKRTVKIPALEKPLAGVVAIPSPTSPLKEEEEEPMSNLQKNLETLRSIDGYIGSCLVDSDSGMMLAADGGGPLNLEVAAAGNTEVVRAKRKAAKSLGLNDNIEDILITLGKQYHLIRPLRARPQIFYYVALDRSKANLAMSRLTLQDTEKALEL